MKSILMLTCQYMPDVFGGAEKQCQRMSTELASRGHRVIVLTSTQTASAPRTTIEQGVRIVRLYTPIAPDLLGRWLLFSVFWHVMVLAWGLAHRKQFDLVHCHQGKFGAFVGTTLGRLLDKPVLVKIGNSEHDMDLLCLQRKAIVGGFMARYVVRHRPVFVAISRVIRQNLAAFGCQDVVAICNGVSTQLRDSNAAAGRSRAGAPRYFFHGRIETIKRIDVLLEAFGRVAQQEPLASLHLIGEGSGLDAAKRHCERLGLNRCVVFHGKADDPLREIADFDIFVNASRSEGFSNSLLEALLLGKVLVSTPVSGSTEAIRPGENGFISDDFSPASLAEAMLKARVLASGDNASQVRAVSNHLVDSRFAMPIVADQYERLYATLTEAVEAGSRAAPGSRPCE